MTQPRPTRLHLIHLPGAIKHLRQPPSPDPVSPLLPLLRCAALQGVRAGGDPFRELCPGRCLPVTAGAPLAPGGPPRFSIHVVDAPETGAEALKKATDHLAAIFLVPQARASVALRSPLVQQSTSPVLSSPHA